MAPQYKRAMQLKQFHIGFIFAFALAMLSGLQLQAGVIEKAFEALEMKDYFKAK